MAINVNYSPIAAGLGLAQKSGQAQRNRTVASQDEAFIQMMQQAQQAEDARYANEIQTSLGVQQHNAQNALAEQDNQRQLAAQQMQAANINTDNQVQQQQLALAQQKQAYAQSEAGRRQEALGGYIQNQVDPTQQGQAAAFAAATGKLPANVLPQAPGQGLDLEYRKADMEYRRTERRLQAALKALKAVQFDGNNLDHLATGKSDTIPEAVKGQEQQYTALKANVDALQHTLSQQEETLISGSGVAPAAIQQIIQARAQQQGASAGNGGGSPPVIHTANEYAALPSGTTYVDAQDGKTYTKR